MNFLLLISLAINIYGYNSDLPVVIAFAQILLCLSFIISHIQQYRLEKLDPIFFFYISMSITSFGHFMAFMNIELKETEYFQYFKNSAPAYYNEAMEIYYIGVLLIILGYKFGMKFPLKVGFINFSIDKISYFNSSFYISMIIVFMESKIHLPGSLNKIFQLFPLISVFLLNIVGYKYKINKFKTFSIVLTITLIIYNLFNSYLRSNIITPLLVYLFSILISEKSLKVFYSYRVIPIAIIFFAFFVSFSKLGELRTMYYMPWEKKLEMLASDDSEETKEDEPEKGSLLSRSTVINQLSQIVRVKEEDGYYYGETMAYISYAFIPRFIWPEKPIIQQGAWFAERIGLAYRNSAGVINNSINMTIYGEAFLNFGYWGVIAICFGFGYFVSKLWQSSGEFKNYFNIIGLGFGLYLLSYAFFQMGADMQIVVTFISIYLLFLLLSYILREFTKNT